MKFCQPHWDRLRQAINDRGLGALVAVSGEKAASNLVREMSDGSSVDSFDPLMGAHNAIFARSMNEIRDKYQQNPLMLMADDTEHPEWACPVCALVWCHDEHNRLCTQEGCNYPKDFDWPHEMIDGAADFMVAEWQRLGTHPGRCVEGGPTQCDHSSTGGKCDVCGLSQHATTPQELSQPGASPDRRTPISPQPAEYQPKGQQT